MRVKVKVKYGTFGINLDFYIKEDDAADIDDCTAVDLTSVVTVTLKVWRAGTTELSKVGSVVAPATDGLARFAIADTDLDITAGKTYNAEILMEGVGIEWRTDTFDFLVKPIAPQVTKMAEAQQITTGIVCCPKCGKDKARKKTCCSKDKLICYHCGHVGTYSEFGVEKRQP